MFTALSWLLDLNQSPAASSSLSYSSASSPCSSRTASRAASLTSPAHTTFVDADGQAVAELQLTSTRRGEEFAVSEEAPPAVSQPPPLVEAFADLYARRTSYFTPSTEVGGGAEAVGRLLTCGVETAALATPRTVPLWSLRRYESEAVSLSPIPSPAPVPDSALVAVAAWAMSELEETPRSARRFTSGRGPVFPKRPPSVTVAAATRSRILEWSDGLDSRRPRSPDEERESPSSLGSDMAGTDAPVTSSGSSPSCRPAVRAALLASAPPPARARVRLSLSAAGCRLEPAEAAASRLHPSNPFLALASTGDNPHVEQPSFSIESMAEPGGEPAGLNETVQAPARLPHGFHQVQAGKATVTLPGMGGGSPTELWQGRVDERRLLSFAKAELDRETITAPSQPAWSLGRGLVTVTSMETSGTGSDAVPETRHDVGGASLSSSS